MHSLRKSSLTLVQRSMALLFFIVGFILLAGGLSWLDATWFNYAACRTCARNVTPTPLSLVLLGATMLVFAVAILLEAYSYQRGAWVGVLAWVLLCVCLARHAWFLDDALPLRLWTGAGAFLFALPLLGFVYAKTKPSV